MTPTLPGDIPGLLQRGSPVLVRDHEVHDRAFGGLVLDIVGGDPFLAITDGPTKLVHLPIRIVALDLSETTGRAHAAWWVSSTASLQRPRGWMLQIDAALGAGHFYAVIDAGCGLPLTDERIDRLRRAVLYLAGRPL